MGFKSTFFSLFSLLLFTSLNAQEALIPIIGDTIESYELKAIFDKWQVGISADKRELIIRSQESYGRAQYEIDGEVMGVEFINGEARLDIATNHRGALHSIRRVENGSRGKLRIFHVSSQEDNTLRLRRIPMWLSILPPLVAIFLALIFKEVIISLFIGIWSGAFIAGGMRIEGVFYLMYSFFEVIHKYMVTAISDSGHIAVILFSLMIGGMVALISKNGGMAGVVNRLSRFAKTRTSSQRVTWLMGIAIFFDDYANALIVGNTVRSVTDKFKVSREKLAYIVDSTAAPVSAVALITTWIGAELGFIDSGIRTIEGFGDDTTPYALFLSSLKYSFYPILTLGFVWLLIRSKRDYGSMYKAEKRATEEGMVKSANQIANDEGDMEDLTPLKSAPKVWHHAAIPVLLVIFVTIFGLVATGFEASYEDLQMMGSQIEYSWTGIWVELGSLTGDSNAGFFQKLGILVGKADSYQALIWASFTGILSAVIISVSNRIMSLKESMYWMVQGFKTMLPALIILVMAWSLALITDELHTADFITSAMQGLLSPYAMPAVIFILAAVISFSTGSSWSTMAILYPIALPTTWALCQVNGLDPVVSQEIMLNVIATVLAASVLGDHCSPISDTTILSSLATDCNHIDHVRTQLPYALTVGGVAFLCVSSINLLGGSWLISLVYGLVSFVVLYLIIRLVGKPIKDV
jgi:Na+/H+ antiporter NhaC